MQHQIAVFKFEKEAGLAEQIKANACISYLTKLEAMAPESALAKELRAAYASEKPEIDFDLYFMKDVLVTSGVSNKNKDVFVNPEVWPARHTSDHKPFNFEHRPLDIIGHITASKAIDDDKNELDDSLSIDELPAKFHILNGSVLYRSSADTDRAALMEKTIGEIEAGEWAVSMECYFRGFDYAVLGPDGIQSIIPRTEVTAWLTKHLVQYGGKGVYVESKTGTEYELGRVLKNITFSGKGLVRNPANPESIIFNSVAAFIPNHKDLGYLSAGVEENSTIEQEISEMPETNAEVQLLQTKVDELVATNKSLAAEMETLKNKDTEAAIASLRSDVESREKRINELTTQLSVATESVASVTKRAEEAEKKASEAQASLEAIGAAQKKTVRLGALAGKVKPEDAEKLVEKLSALDDAAFAETVAFLPDLPAPTKPAKADETAAIDKAKIEKDPALATAGETEQREASQAKTQEFFKTFFRTARVREAVASE